MRTKWRAVITITSPAGVVVKEIKRVVRGPDRAKAESNARYMARPWAAPGDKITIDLTFLESNLAE